jgi:hypothetical protein
MERWPDVNICVRERFRAEVVSDDEYELSMTLADGSRARQRTIRRGRAWFIARRAVCSAIAWCAIPPAARKSPDELHEPLEMDTWTP